MLLGILILGGCAAANAVAFYACMNILTGPGPDVDFLDMQ